MSEKGERRKWKEKIKGKERSEKGGGKGRGGERRGKKRRGGEGRKEEQRAKGKYPTISQSCCQI